MNADWWIVRILRTVADTHIPYVSSMGLRPAPLLCRRRRRWVAVADAADRRDEMGLPGDSRGIRVRRNTSQKLPGVPVAVHSITLWRLAAWSGALASDMCKRRRVASSYSRCGPDMACLGGSVICNLRRQRQWHPGIASAVLCTSRNRNSRPD